MHRATELYIKATKTLNHSAYILLRDGKFAGRAFVFWSRSNLTTRAFVFLADGFKGQGGAGAGGGGYDKATYAMYEAFEKHPDYVVKDSGYDWVTQLKEQGFEVITVYF